MATDSSFEVGQRVQVAGRFGTVRFAGNTQFADGVWIGIELDEAVGKNAGSVKGVEYFTCPPEHGIFVRPTMVTAIANADQQEPKIPPASGAAGKPEADQEPTPAAQGQPGRASVAQAADSDAAATAGQTRQSTVLTAKAEECTNEDTHQSNDAPSSSKMDQIVPDATAQAVTETSTENSKTSPLISRGSEETILSQEESIVSQTEIKPQTKPAPSSAPAQQLQPAPQSPSAPPQSPPASQQTQVSADLQLAAAQILQTAQSAQAAAEAELQRLKEEALQMRDALERKRKETEQEKGRVAQATQRLTAAKEMRRTIPQPQRKKEQGTTEVKAVSGRSDVADLEAFLRQKLALASLARSVAQGQLEEKRLELMELELQIEDAVEATSASFARPIAEYQEALRALSIGCIREVAELENKMVELDRETNNSVKLKKDSEDLIRKQCNLQERIADLETEAAELASVTEAGNRLLEVSNDVIAELHQELELSDQRSSQLEDLARRLEQDRLRIQAATKNETLRAKDLLQEVMQLTSGSVPTQEGDPGNNSKKVARRAVMEIKQNLAELDLELAKFQAKSFSSCFPPKWAALVDKELPALKDLLLTTEASNTSTTRYRLQVSRTSEDSSNYPQRFTEVCTGIQKQMEATFSGQKQVMLTKNLAQEKKTALESIKEQIQKAEARRTTLQETLHAVTAKLPAEQLGSEEDALREEAKILAATQASLVRDLEKARAKREDQERAFRETQKQRETLEQDLLNLRQRPAEDGRATVNELAALRLARQKDHRDLYALQVSAIETLTPLCVDSHVHRREAAALDDSLKRYQNLRQSLLHEWSSAKVQRL